VVQKLVGAEVVGAKGKVRCLLASTPRRWAALAAAAVETDVRSRGWWERSSWRR
jgi:hypothetical protein